MQLPAGCGNGLQEALQTEGSMAQHRLRNQPAASPSNSLLCLLSWHPKDQTVSLKVSILISSALAQHTQNISMPTRVPCSP